MNSLQIEIFLAVAKYQNYSEASRQLFISQPAISKNIAALEEELGLRLFYRNSKSVQLTQEGTIIRNTLETMTETFRNVLDSVRSLSQESISLSVLFLEGLDVGHMIAPIITAMKEYPQVSFSFEFALIDTLLQNLNTGSTDIIVTFEDSIRKECDIDYFRLGRTQTGIILNKNDKLAAYPALSPELLQNVPIYCEPQYYKTFEKQLSAVNALFGFTPEQYHFVPDVDSQLLSVEIGLGISIVNHTKRIANNHILKFYPIESLSNDIVIAWKYDNDKVISSKLPLIARKCLSRSM